MKVCIESLTDEQLIHNIRNGEKESLSILIEKYKPVVAIKAKAFFLIGAEHDDIIQEGLIGLLNAVKNFNEEKGIAFKTFAELCIKRQIITAIKLSTRQKHLPLNSYVSLNKPILEEEPGSSGEYIDFISSEQMIDPQEIMITKEFCKNLECTMNKVLSDFEYSVLTRYVNGNSYEDMADKLRTNKKGIDNAIQRIKKKIGKHIIDY